MATILTLGILPTSGVFQKADLGKMWKEFENMRQDRNPSDCLDILDKIRQEALRQHNSYYFLASSSTYVEVSSAIDWHRRDSLVQEFKENVDAFDDPLVSFLYKSEYEEFSSDERLEFIKENEAKLKAGKSTTFYKSDYIYFPLSWLSSVVSSDYEAALWCVDDDEYPWAVLLKDYLKDSYPNAAVVEYYLATVSDSSSSEKEMIDVATRYDGRAIGLLAEDYLLKAKFNKMDEHSSEDAYKALMAECEALVARSKTFTKGVEKKIASDCTHAQDILATLHSKEIDASLNGRELSIALRNVAKVKVSLYDLDQDSSRESMGGEKTPISSWDLSNTRRSFYAIDTLNLTLPDVDDGKWEVLISGEKVKTICRFNKYSYCFAYREECGLSLYGAEAESGKPLSRAVLNLQKDNELLLSREFDFSPDGFTPISEEFARLITSFDRVSLQLYLTGVDPEGRKLKSSPLSYWTGSWGSSSSGVFRHDLIGKRGNIYKDRGAYTPGDTLQFKFISYFGDTEGEYKLLPNEDFTAILHDCEGNKISDSSLRTSDFGSAAGSFVIPKGLRGGRFSLVIEDIAGERVASDSFRVDEFVLPSYEIFFDEDDALHLPGDDITVRGRVLSYSGHSLAGSRVEATIVQRYSYDASMKTIPVYPAADGSFSFSFSTDSNDRGYSVELKLTSRSGESLSASTYRSTHSYFRLNAILENEAKSKLVLPQSYYSGELQMIGNGVVTSDVIRLTPTVALGHFWGNTVPKVPVSCSLVSFSGETIAQKNCMSGATVTFDTSTLPSAFYKVVLTASACDSSGKEYTESAFYGIVKQKDTDARLGCPIDFLALEGDSVLEYDEDICCTLASSEPTWAVVSLFAPGLRRLSSSIVKLEAGQITRFSQPYLSSYGKCVRLCVNFFRGGKFYSYDMAYRIRSPKVDFPLSLTGLPSKLLPGEKATIKIHSSADTQILVAVFDKSLDAMGQNNWEKLPFKAELEVRCPSISTSEGGARSWVDTGRRLIRGYGQKSSFMAKAEMYADNAVAMGAVDDDMEYSIESSIASDDVLPEALLVMARENFATILAFEPFLITNASGEAEFSFEAADKLSTYYIYVFAHDKNAASAFTKEEVMVTKPVKLEFSPVRYFMSTDHPCIAVALSSTADTPISGTLTFVSSDHCEQGSDMVHYQTRTVRLDSGIQTSETFEVEIPEGARSLQLKTVFTPSSRHCESGTDVAISMSDAIQITVPVLPASLSLREAHSCLLLNSDPAYIASKIESLRSLFVNGPGAEASVREKVLIDAVNEALEARCEVAGEDLVSILDAYYLQPSDELEKKILDCRCADGGFAWFPGMKSSPLMTAFVLDRFARLRDHDVEIPDLRSSVEYLDRVMYREDVMQYYWLGISLMQYLDVRSCYAQVPFTVKINSSNKEIYKSRQKEMRSFLLPSKKAASSFLAYDELLRVNVISHLQDTGASSLLRAWGLSGMNKLKLAASKKKSLQALLGYVVEHPNGGRYLPNLVLPYRGLMASEAYAHAVAASMLTSLDEEYPSMGLAAIADQIRLFILLQKDTQSWSADPAYLDALNCVLESKDETILSSRMLILEASFDLPASEIKASGNGMGVSAEYFRVLADGSRQALHDGATLHVGDKVVAVYSLDSVDNRSFVRLSAPRAACLMPSEQRSGLVGFFPSMAYRDVRGDRSIYYFDSFPEYKSKIEEDFNVTCEGIFTAMPSEIECLYAPEYRGIASSFEQFDVVSR